MRGLTKSLAAAAFIALFILANGFFSYRIIGSLQERDRWVTHTQEVLLNLQAALRGIIEAESGQRGFIITGEASFLGRYDAARERARSSVENVAGLTRDNPTQQASVASLRKLMNVRMDLLERNMRPRRQGLNVSVEVLDEGRTAMDAVRATIAEMQDHESALLVTRKQEALRAYSRLTASIVIAAAISFALVTLAGIQVYRDHAAALKHTHTLEESSAKLRASEQELRALNESLEQRVRERTSQLQEINGELKAFSYTIAHDLRAPLRGMQGFAHALKEDNGAQLDATGRQYVEYVITAAERMNALISDLLEYSKLSREELQLGATMMHAVVMNAIEQVDALVQESKAHISVDESSIDVTVKSHAPTLLQAIANIVNNAVKFVPPGTQPQVRIHGERRGDKFRLWVEDNGIGIAAEHQQRIFQPFERLHGVDRYPGTGIGLAIVRKAAERMNGAAGVESKLGHGSRFWIELPMMSSGVAQNGSPSTLHPPR